MDTNMTQPPAAMVNSEPIKDFSNCHAGILKELDRLGELPALLEPAARAREIAEKAVHFFREAIFEHHLDEERELFPVVLAHAEKGSELERVQGLVNKLVNEHRELEAAWKRLEPGLMKAAKGQYGDVNATEIQRLVTCYRAHAVLEESEFLPLSQAILGRNANHMAALGLSLHMRHSPPQLIPYI